MKTQISAAVKLTFQKKRKCLRGREIGGTQKKEKGNTSFGSTPNTHKTYGACLLAAIACLGHVIVSTVTFCYSRVLVTGLNAVILTRFCAMFRLRRSKCYESFESESGVGGGGGGGGARFRSFFCKSVHIPGRATAAARTALPIPAIVCSFVCVSKQWCGALIVVWPSLCPIKGWHMLRLPCLCVSGASSLHSCSQRCWRRLPQK